MLEAVLSTHCSDLLKDGDLRGTHLKVEFIKFFTGYWFVFTAI